MHASSRTGSRTRQAKPRRAKPPWFSHSPRRLGRRGRRLTRGGGSQSTQDGTFPGLPDLPRRRKSGREARRRGLLLAQCLEKIRCRADRPRGGWGELSSRYCAGIAAGSGWGWGSARLSTCAWLGAGEWGMHTHDCCHTHMHELICGSVRCDAAFQRVNRSRAAELSRRGATAKDWVPGTPPPLPSQDGPLASWSELLAADNERCERRRTDLPLQSAYSTTGGVRR